MRSTHWFDHFFALLPPYYSSCKPQTDAYLLPDEGGHGEWLAYPLELSWTPYVPQVCLAF